MTQNKNNNEIFQKLKKQLLMLDPVNFAENYLTLEGEPFRLTNNGFKPFCDLYRYIGIKALEPDAKPILLVKSRQIGGSIMACVMEMYFMGSGLFGVDGKPPMRVIHAFPLLEHAAAYSKTKLTQMIAASVRTEDSADKKTGKIKSYMQSLLDTSSATNDSLTFKQFVGGNHLWIESTGIDADRLMGRQLSLETELPTPTGFIKLKDLRLGDQLFDENGEICRVTKLYPIDMKPESYRITFDDGTIIEACADHLWKTYTAEDRKNLSKFTHNEIDILPEPTIKTTKEILETLNYLGAANHAILNSLPLQFSEKKLDIAPYLFGLKIKKQNKISDNYMQGDINQRLSLLQGIMDKCGIYNKDSCCKLIMDKESLAYQVYELILSLGIKARIKKYWERFYIKFNSNLQVFRLRKRNIKFTFRDKFRYIENINRIESIPMRCIEVDSASRLFLITKQCIPTHNSADVIFFDECFPADQNIKTIDGKATIFEIHEDFINGKEIFVKSFNEKLNYFEDKKVINVFKRGKKELVELNFRSMKIRCTENHLFLTKEGWKAANKLVLGDLVKKYNSNNCEFEVFEYLERLDSIEETYDIEVEDNHNFIVTSKEDYSGLIVHNCQKITDLALGNALKILTSSKYGKPGKGVQIYFGTPRRKGTSYHKMWLSSSQQYYYLGCEKCNQHFPLYTPGSDDWEKIWIYGFIVKCPHCGFEQDKRDAAERGKWVALRDYREEDCKFIGFHINQLYFPTFKREDLDNEKPGRHPINTERIYQTEVLGEFFQGDTSPITPEEIAELCADRDRKFSARINPGDRSLVVLGIDYGLRADVEQLAHPESKISGQSYSTAVVLSAKGPGLLSIEFCTKFKRNDPASKKGIIDQIIRQYNIQLAIGDIGFSQDFSSELHHVYGDKYLVSRAHSKVNNYAKFRSDVFPKEIIFERDYHIRELYELLKKGQIRFPFKDYEKVAWLIDHCCSMEIKPSISKTGADPVVHYVKGSTANDGFMALLNAYLAYKFLVTKGFTDNNPFSQEENLASKNKPLIITGYIPRRM